MEEPRSGIVRDEPDGHVVARAVTYRHDVAPDGVHEIRRVATCNSDDVKAMLRESA